MPVLPARQKILFLLFQIYLSIHVLDADQQVLEAERFAQKISDPVLERLMAISMFGLPVMITNWRFGSTARNCSMSSMTFHGPEMIINECHPERLL